MIIRLMEIGLEGLKSGASLLRSLVLFKSGILSKDGRCWKAEPKSTMGGAMQIGRRGIPLAVDPGLEPSRGVAGPLNNLNSAFLGAGRAEPLSKMGGAMQIGPQVRCSAAQTQGRGLRNQWACLSQLSQERGLRAPAECHVKEESLPFGLVSVH